MPNDRFGSDNGSRKMGVEFGQLIEELSTQEYPVERETLLAEYGEYALETESSSQSLQSILGRQEDETDAHEYQSADAVQQAVLNMVGSGAVGREEYSDRGGSTPQDDEDNIYHEDKTL